jgi:hypothetical protein
VSAGVGARATGLVVREVRPAGSRALTALAHEAGVHPELVRRLVALGVLDAGQPRDAARRVARAARLRRDLGLNYAGALLACELLDRIDRLERQLSRYETADRKRR